MLTYRCDRCMKILGYKEEFFGITFYKYTNKADYISPIFHLCKDCYNHIQEQSNNIFSFRFKKIKDGIEWYDE